MRPDQDLVKWQGDDHWCGQSVSCRCCWYDDTWHHHITIPGCQIVECCIFSYYVNYWFCCLCYNTTVVHGKENIDSVLSGRIGPALSVVNHNSCFDDHDIMISREQCYHHVSWSTPGSSATRAWNRVMTKPALVVTYCTLHIIYMAPMSQQPIFT